MNIDKSVLLSLASLTNRIDSKRARWKMSVCSFAGMQEAQTQGDRHNLPEVAGIHFWWTQSTARQWVDTSSLDFSADSNCRLKTSFPSRLQTGVGKAVLVQAWGISAERIDWYCYGLPEIEFESSERSISKDTLHKAPWAAYCGRGEARKNGSTPNLLKEEEEGSTSHCFMTNTSSFGRTSAALLQYVRRVWTFLNSMLVVYLQKLDCDPHNRVYSLYRHILRGLSWWRLSVIILLKGPVVTRQTLGLL